MRIIINANQSRLEEAGGRKCPLWGCRDHSEGCACALGCTLLCAHALICPHIHMHSHAHSQAHTCTHTCAGIHMHCMCILMGTQMHSHTSTHTQDVFQGCLVEGVWQMGRNWSVLRTAIACPEGRLHRGQGADRQAHRPGPARLSPAGTNSLPPAPSVLSTQHAWQPITG